LIHAINHPWSLGKKYSYLQRHPGLNDPEGLKAPPLHALFASQTYQEAAEKLEIAKENIPQGLKPKPIFKHLRHESCPDTKPGFSAAC
jgi:hypothetical protein